MPKAIQKRAAAPGSNRGLEDVSAIKVIEGSQTPELVLGFCGPVGSGTTTVALEVAKILHRYAYKPINIITISDLIWRYINKIKHEVKAKFPDVDIDPQTIEEPERTEVLQYAGNLLRQKIGNDVLAQFAIREISLERQKEPENGSEKESEGQDVKPKKARRATILDSLKNPAEIELLRAVYPNMFYLFGVLCPESLRKIRLVQGKRFKPVQAEKVIQRDKSEEEKYGQKLIDTFHLSDFFVRNTKENVQSFLPSLERFVDIMLGRNVITPTMEETAMYAAQSAALRSACLSRQVGAAIMNSEGEIIATGCNDVPRFNGGLYATEDQSDDNRCMNIYGKRCQSDKYKEEIFDEIERCITEIVPDGESVKKISDCIRNHKRLKSLIEFCRAIHAEMDAITSVARKGGLSLRGSSLFCTTYPCHSCARHIVAAGIKAVYYIEPYEKSLALRLHRDAIEFDPESGESPNKVSFLPFEGVAPRCFASFFKARDRKRADGSMIEVKKESAMPVIVQRINKFFDCEALILKELARLGFVEEAPAETIQQTETPS
jgi:deoxycytidylate deaminase